jgi:LmbE family N-acetylglucosaminyl deacetylase
MMPLQLGKAADEPLRLLCLGAHSDDIEIGCGGTVLSLLRAWPRTSVHWVVFSASEAREREARHSAQLFLQQAAHSEVAVHGFRDGFFPYLGGQIKDIFEGLKRAAAPDIVFTHHAGDRHQDHRLICELAWNTFRDHLIVEYEIPKWDGDLTTPQLYVPLEENVRRAKLRYLQDSFVSQRDKHWFSESTFEGLMRLRGVESASPTGYAEAFHLRKASLVLSGERPATP